MKDNFAFEKGLKFFGAVLPLFVLLLATVFFGEGTSADLFVFFVFYFISLGVYIVDALGNQEVVDGTILINWLLMVVLLIVLSKFHYMWLGGGILLPVLIAEKIKED